VLFEEAAIPLDLRHASDTTGHVNELSPAGVLEVEGTDYRGSCLFGAGLQRLEPAGPNDDIVLEEDHVRRLDLAKSQVSQSGQGHEIRRPDETEALRLRLLLQVPTNTARRVSVHVDELERRGGVVVQGLEGDFRPTEALAGEHDDRHRGDRWHGL